MNKIVASLGMAALGASSIQAVLADDLGAPAAKPWSISASLRGFYDDNINGTQTGQVKSWGFEVAPSASVIWKTDQTSIDAKYIYSYRWFDQERFLNQGHDSQSHLFNGAIDHTFSERYSVSSSDWFAIGQEPDLFRDPTYGITPSPYPIPGNNIHNYGTINFDGQLTPIIGFEVGYDNSYYNYEQQQFATIFDRIEQTVHLNVNWRVQRDTTAFVGYQFGWIRYQQPAPDITDNHSHYVYVGVTHNFTPELEASVTAGGRFIDFENLNATDSSPYVRAYLRYLYCPESYVEAGFTYDLAMTGVFTAQSAETAVFYGTVHHRIIPKLFANLTGEVQNSSIVGGPLDGKDAQYYTVGLNIEYEFARHFSAGIGYDFDKVQSQFGPDYNRNRVYFGITASY
jgi:hypothetical protein